VKGPASSSSGAPGETREGAQPRGRRDDDPNPTPTPKASSSERDAKAAPERDGKAPPPKAEAKPEKAPSPYAGSKHKVRTESGDVEVDYDELVRGYGHQRAANDRMKQAAELRKQLEPKAALADAVEAARTKGDFKALVDHIGLDATTDFALDFINQKIEWDSLSEDQQEQLRRNRRLETFESREKAEQDAAEKKEADARRQKREAAAGQEIDDEIGEVLEKLGRKATPRVASRIIEDMLANLETKDSTSKRPSASDLYAKVETEIWSDIAEYLEDLPIAEARKRLPKKFLEALRQSDVDDALAQDPFRSGEAVPSKTQREEPRRGKPQRMSTDAWFDKLDKKISNRR